MWLKLLAVGLGGAFGAIGRVELARAIEWLIERYAPATPINVGLLVVNVLGCFLFGLVWSVLHKKMALDSATSWAVLAGFLGAFTTFSTFAFESTAVFDKAGLGWAGVHLVAHNLIGVMLMLVGLAVGRALV